MSTISLHTITDESAARELFEAFAPPHALYHTWEFRAAFWHPFHYPLHFIAAYVADTPVVLMPLQHNTNTGYYEFFGGSFMEDNQMYMKNADTSVISLLFDYIRTLPTSLSYVSYQHETAKYLQKFEYRYGTNLKAISSFDAFVSQQFQGQSKGKLIRKLKKFEAQYQPRILDGTVADIDTLAQLNIASFGSESTFTWPHRTESYRTIAAAPFDAHIIRVEIGTTLAAVSLGILYGGTYSYMNVGVDKKFSNLGTYMIAQNVMRAIALGAQYFDPLATSCNWKELWHLEKTPQYHLIIK